MVRGIGCRRWFVGLLALVQSGCFVGYDSRWGQQKQAQRQLAAARTPTSLETTDGAGSAAPRPLAVTTMRVRIEATAAYAAQVVDYARRFQRTLEAVNGMLEPERSASGSSSATRVPSIRRAARITSSTCSRSSGGSMPARTRIG